MKREAFVLPAVALFLEAAAGTVVFMPTDAIGQPVQYTALPSCGGLPLVYDPGSLTFSCGTNVLVENGVTLTGDVVGIGGPVVPDVFAPINAGNVLANPLTINSHPTGELIIGGVSLQWPQVSVMQEGTYMVSPGFPWTSRLTTLDSVAAVVTGTTNPGFHLSAHILGQVAGTGDPQDRGVTGCDGVGAGTNEILQVCDAAFTAVITGTQMIVIGVSRGAPGPNQVLVAGTGTGVLDNTYIVQAVSVDMSGTGTWEISPAQTQGTQQITSKQGFNGTDILYAVVSNITGTPEIAGARFNLTHGVQ